jgi:hypothetical protein
MEFWGSITFTSLPEVLRESFSRPGSRNWKLVGLLFVKGGDELAEKSLKPFFGYFNNRSRTNTDFYWAGWDEIVSDTPNSSGQYLSFNDNHFDTIRRDVESNTNWRYSGGADLILFPAKKLDTGEVVMDLGAAMNINLRELKAAKIEPDVLFETIFRFSDNSERDDSMFELFFDNTRRSLSKSFWLFLKSFVSSEASQEIDRINAMVVVDIRKPDVAPLRSLGPPSSRHSYPVPRR